MIKHLFGAAVFAATLCFGAGQSVAQDVTLTSRDGSIQVSGALTSFDGEFYRIETEYGQLVLDGQGVVCSGPGCPDLEAYVAEFTLSGDPKLGRLLIPALLESYADRRGLAVTRIVEGADAFRLILRDENAGRDVARIEVRQNSTAEGFADLVTGEADITMAARPVRGDEVALGQTAGLGDLSEPGRSRVVALDAVIPVVALGNPVTSMQVEDLGAILSGAVTEWPGEQGSVVLHGLENGTGPRQAVQDGLLTSLGLTLSEDMRRHNSDAEVADAVAQDVNALAVVGLSERGNALPVTLRGGCGIPLPATRHSLKTGDYPFTAPLFLYLPERRLPLFAREFLRYLRSPAAQLVIRRAGFVDQSREEIGISNQGLRLANAIGIAGGDVPLDQVQGLLADLGDARRLTTTFRFEGGQSRLEPQSAGNVISLARDLESGLYDDQELIFVGFSDGEGSWEVNKRLSQTRAEAVREAVRTAALTADPSRLRLSVAGYGEALPIACDDTDWGKRVNRRVEVWVRDLR